MNQVEKGREYFSLAVRMTTDPIALYKCARFCHKTNAPETALGYQRAIVADFHSVKTWFHFSRYLADSGENLETTLMSFAATLFVASATESDKIFEYIRQYAKRSGQPEKQVIDCIVERIQSPAVVSTYWNNKLST